MTRIPRPMGSGVLVFLLCWLAAGDPVRLRAAVVPTHAGLEFQLRHWSPETGLPDSRVHALAQTRDGYLWLGTRVGVARFNGLAFSLFNRVNTPVLPDNGVRQLVGDDAGALWVGTGLGSVVRGPDGGWSEAKPPGEAGVTFRADWLAGPRSVWARGTDAIWYRAPSGGSSPFAAFPRTRDAVAVHEGPAGDLWWVTRQSLFRQLAGTEPVTEWRLGAPSEGQEFAYFSRTPDGTLWLLHGLWRPEAEARLFRVQATEPEEVDHAPAGKRLGFAFLASDRDGTLWHPASPGTVGAWRPGQGRELGLAPFTENFPVASFLADREGCLWIGSEWNGLIRLRPRQVTVVGVTEGLPNEHVRAVLPLRDGRLAIGTDAGLAFLGGPAGADRGGEDRVGRLAGLPGVGPLPGEPAVAGSSVRALAEDGTGRLWVGTSRGLFAGTGGIGGGGCGPVDLPMIRHPADKEGLASLKVRGLVAGRSGDVWVLTPRMVHVFPRGESRARTLMVAPRSVALSGITEDSRGRLWVATDGLGVIVFGRGAGGQRAGGEPREGWETVGEDWRGLPDDPSPVEPEPGPRLHRKPLAWLTATNGLSSACAWDTWEDSTGALWIACENGLNYLSPRAVERLASGADARLAGAADVAFQFTTEQGLPGHLVNSFVEDGRGSLWFGTDHGIFRARREDLVAVAEGRRERVPVVEYGEADGLPSAETSGQVSRPGAVLAADGRVWFATVRGLVGIDPARPHRSEVAPRVAIEEVRADEEVIFTTLPGRPRGGPAVPGGGGERLASAPVSGGGLHVVLPPGRAKVVEFHFAGLSFPDPERVLFRYRLEGYETAWHEAGTRRVAYYTNLDPGEYRFLVQASNRRGDWADEPAGFGFRLSPFLWQTLWFRGLAALAGAGLVVALVAWRVREIRRQAELEQQNALLRERASIARDIHDDLGPRLTQLALLTGLAESRRPGSSTSAVPGSGPGPGPQDSARRQLALLARDLANTLDGTLWTVEPTGDTLPSFADYLADFAADFVRTGGLSLELAIAESLPSRPLSRIEKRHLFLFAKEALNNVLKHASARRVELRLEPVGQGFRLEIADDGCGVGGEAGGNAGTGVARDPAQGRTGGGGARSLGLESLRLRAEELGGRLQVASEPGKGTRLVLVVPGPAPV